MQKQIIPIVYSVDDHFANLLSLSIKTIYDNASDVNDYKIYILNDGLNQNTIDYLNGLNKQNFSIEYVNVASIYKKFKNILCVRDNYTEAIYYRMLIPSIFPEYDKIIYLDADTVLLKDIAEMYSIDIGDNLLGATVEETVANTKVFQDYCVNYLNFESKYYFNSGVLLMNAKEFRKQDIEGQFSRMLKKIVFRMAPDQDFLNVLCFGKVKYIPMGWNKSPLYAKDFDEKDLGLIHYNLTYKPWKFDNVLYEDYFWNIAKKAGFYDYFKNIKDNVTKEDIAKAENNVTILVNIAKDCAYNSDSPLKRDDFFDGIRKQA